MSKHVIFAAHPDDELIGCYQQLKAGVISNIYYFDFELVDEVRRAEAKKLEALFGVHVYFLHDDTEYPILDKDTVIHVHHIRDTHAHHKQVNFIAKIHYSNNPKCYYSVDMNVGKVLLPEVDRVNKKQLLYDVFPSQCMYFDLNPQCYLFEAHLNQDIDTTISVSTQFVGYHRYPDAPALVAFLRNLHRHVFHVDVTLSVQHDDRDVEFFMFVSELDTFISCNPMPETASCEEMAKRILNFVIQQHPYRDFYEVSVAEDRENKATVTFRVQ